MLMHRIHFPAKMILFNTLPSVVQKRRAALQSFLSEILQCADVVECLPLREFLQLPANTTPLHSPSVSRRISGRSPMRVVCCLLACVV